MREVEVVRPTHPAALKLCAGSGAGGSRNSGNATTIQHRLTDNEMGNRPTTLFAPPRLPASALSFGPEVRNRPASDHRSAKLNPRPPG